MAHCLWCDDRAVLSDHDCPDRPAGASSDADAVAFAIGELFTSVNEAIETYIELEAALPPKQSESEGRTATKVHAPLPLDVDTVDKKRMIHELIKYGQWLRKQHRALIEQMMSYNVELRATIAGVRGDNSVHIGPCRTPSCSGVLKLAAGADFLECTGSEDATGKRVTHAIPRTMWGLYYDRSVR